MYSLFCQIISADSGGTVPEPPPEPPWLFLTAIAICIISGFLFYEAVRLHVWATKRTEGAPNPPMFGVALAVVGSLFVGVMSLFYLFVRYPPPDNARGDFSTVQNWYFLHHPSELAAGVALSSIVPSAVAIYTFMMAGFIMRDKSQESPLLSHSPKAALAGTIFSFISLAGSIATLITFFFWIKNR